MKLISTSSFTTIIPNSFLGGSSLKSFISRILEGEGAENEKVFGGKIEEKVYNPGVAAVEEAVDETEAVAVAHGSLSKTLERKLID